MTQYMKAFHLIGAGRRRKQRREVNVTTTTMQFLLVTHFTNKMYLKKKKNVFANVN